VTVLCVLTHAEISCPTLIPMVLSISIVLSTVRRNESYFRGKKKCEDLKALVGFEVCVKCHSGCQEGMQVLFYYKISGSDIGIAVDSSFLLLDSVLLDGWFPTFQRIVDTYQKN
jgi:hypothetical protein